MAEKRSWIFKLILAAALLWGLSGSTIGHADGGGLFLPLLVGGSGSGGACASAPTLLNPADSSVLTTLVPRFQWDRGSDPSATAMTLQVASDAAFTNMEGTYRTTSAHWTTEFRFPWNFDPGVAYYWRAYLTCGSVQGPYSEIWTLVTGQGGTLLAAPTLISPADGFTLSGTTVTLQWSPVSGAAEYLVLWRISPSGSTMSRFSNATQTVVGGFSSGSTYDWWVSAVDAYAIGTPSEVRQFSVP
jgi:hypothetical protein